MPCFETCRTQSRGKQTSQAIPILGIVEIFRIIPETEERCHYCISLVTTPYIVSLARPAYLPKLDA